MNRLTKVFWSNKYIMFIGDELSTEFHSHQGIQISMSLNGDITVNSQLNHYTGQMIVLDSNVPHQVKCNEKAMMMLIERESKLGMKLSKMLQEPVVIINGVDDIHKAVCDLINHESLKKSDKIYQMLEAFIDVEKTSMDSRIKDVLLYISKNFHLELSSEALAKQCYLSESRFQHLFKSNMGVSLSKYLLWARVKHAITLISNGYSFTEAAIESGFSDSSHFSRTLKSNFGVVLRTLLIDSSSVQVIIE